MAILLSRISLALSGSPSIMLGTFEAEAWFRKWSGWPWPLLTMPLRGRAPQAHDRVLGVDASGHVGRAVGDRADGTRGV